MQSTIDGRMEQAVELLLNYSPANPPAVRSLPAAPSPPTPTDPGQVASRIEQIDLSIASLTSQKIDCVQREQYAAAQRHVFKKCTHCPMLGCMLWRHEETFTKPQPHEIV